jgi:Uncharacterized protein conserved in bacteria
MDYIFSKGAKHLYFFVFHGMLNVRICGAAAPQKVGYAHFYIMYHFIGGGSLPSKVEIEAESIAKTLCAKHSVEFVDTEFVKEGKDRFLRIYIYRKNGLDMNTCEAFHMDLIPLVEQIDYDYLEVSSPGDRAFTRPEDYVRMKDTLVEVNLYEAVQKKKRYEGTLLGLFDGCVHVQSGKDTLVFLLEKIISVKPAFHFTLEE